MLGLHSRIDKRAFIESTSRTINDRICRVLNRTRIALVYNLNIAEIDMATIKKAVVTTNENGLTFEITGGNKLSIKLDDLSADIIHQATLHGLKQKIADSYAGVTTSHEVEESASNVIMALMFGNWNAGRSKPRRYMGGSTCPRRWRRNRRCESEVG